MKKDLSHSIGEKHNKLTIIALEGIKYGKQGYKCICECGEYFIATYCRLISNKDYCCQLCKNKEINIRKQKAIISTSSKCIMNDNYKDFNGTLEQFTKLILGNCHYCNSTPMNVFNLNKNTFIYNGLDRIDNSKGHTLDNVVPCCKYCNYSKRDLTQQDFYNWIILTKQHLNKKRI